MAKRDTFRLNRSVVLLSLVILAAPILLGQGTQTGTISGRVTMADGSPLPGVTVEARSPVLPQARVTTTNANGEYRFPVLPPGDYRVQFSLSGMATRTRNVRVLLNQTSVGDAVLGMEGVAETITVTADTPLIDTTSTEIRSALSSEVIDSLPVGQEYRDLVKLLPGVMYTQDQVRGPSAGGSGQDNTYQFDGVNVSRPQYGSLTAEPSSYDIDQVNVMKGGARAVDFVRSAGFTVNTLSKSGTNEFSGQVSYQVQDQSFTSDQKTASAARFDQDKSWITLGVGGPILRDRLFFYGSYYRPEVEQENRENLYGVAPTYKSERNEGFGKLTFTPTNNLLLHGSYRKSEREVRGDMSGFTASRAGTTSSGAEITFEVAILEGSWIVSPNAYATFRATDYTNENLARPDLLLNFPVTIDGSARLDVANLDRMGFFRVPQPIAGNTAFNNFIAPLIDRYGYLNNGVRTGGGIVGAGLNLNDQDFFRRTYQAGYNHTFGSDITHEIHVGYQWNEDKEDLTRIYNGWGDISVPGGRTSFQGTPIFYTARIIRGALPEYSFIRNIVSSIESNNAEINDTIRWNNWTFNVGLVFSQDTLYGQGLREDSSTLSGYVSAPGNRYKMYEIGWDEMIQPRVGATWAYNGTDTVFSSYARYYPSTTSLPRAASWDRNIQGAFVDVHFDATGNLIGSAVVGSSSGKLFADDLDPRFVDEYLIGTARQLTNRLTTRLYARHRYSANFWEDTNNNARELWAPEGYPKDLYIPDLSQRLAQIGSGSSYVIAELDGAFTKYYEATMESEWRGSRAFMRGSYTWSHYYGNFDQDNTATDNDQDTFVGSSNLGDGPGRQIWDNRYGDLRGDRRHLLKLYGSYSLPWAANVGGLAIYQSGQPWEAWDYRVYSHLPGFGTSTSDLIRNAEPAGSRRTDDHYQMDLNYTQNIPLGGYNFQIAADVYNVFDKQTGYNPQPSRNSALFGQPRNFYDPRRFQLAVRFQF
jgi:hypothetical protein